MRVITLFFLLALCTSLISGQSFASFDGTTIAYTDEGNGPVVILIHGFINTNASWQGTEVYKQLLTQGYRVIAPDLRGNGNSDKPQLEKAYANNAEVKDLTALIDHLNIDTAIALGYSRGSIVLAKWLTIDDRISKAIIGGMGLDFSNPLWERRILFEEAFLGLSEGTKDTQGAIRYAQSQGADIRILGWSQRYQPVTPPEELSKITIPVLVIAGDKDAANGSPKELAELFPNAELSIITGDHNTTYRKGTFAQEVIKYLMN